MSKNRIDTINQNVPNDLFNYQGLFDKKVTLECCNCDHEWQDNETWSSPYCPKCSSQVIKEKD